MNFNDGKNKGIVDDLINISIFLKEKGEPFRVLAFKLAKCYLTEEGYFENAIESKIFEQIGTFAIDTVASKKLNLEFYCNYSILLSFEILTDMVELHSY